MRCGESKIPILELLENCSTDLIALILARLACECNTPKSSLEDQDEDDDDCDSVDVAIAVGVETCPDVLTVAMAALPSI